MKLKIIFSTIISIVLSFVCTGCDNNISSENEVNYRQFKMNYDYGKIVENKVTLLYDSSYISNDLSKFNINKSDLKAGDIVEFTFNGEFDVLESYPEQIRFEDNQIIDVELFKANIVNFTVYSVPGGGYDIVADDGKNYKLPKNLIYEDNFTSTKNIYPDLRIVGTMPYNSTTNMIEALYAINYDPLKLKEDNHHEFICNDESLNNYFVDLIDAMNYTKQGNYVYHLSVEDDNGSIIEKHYLKKDNEEYIYFYDKNEVKNLQGCLIEIYDNYYAINTGKVRYINENITSLTKQFLKNEYIINEEKLINFYDKNKPLVNNGIYGNYKISINAIDPCCNGPIYIAFDDITTENKEDATIELSTSYLHYSSFFSDKYTLSVEEYIEDIKEKTSLIQLDGQYQLLDKLDTYPNDNYEIAYGFSDYTFHEKKYVDSGDNNTMNYDVTNYPDYSFSNGKYITRIYISDENVTFNGLTLNNSFDEIIDCYVKIGFTINDENDSTLKLIDNKGQVIILVSKTCDFIDFSVKITNLLQISD